MEEYKVKKEDLIGQLEGFPIEVVQKMVDHQIEQGNKADVTAFQIRNSVDKYNGGFNWEETAEKVKFWTYIIYFNDFNLFLKKYPKK